MATWPTRGQQAPQFWDQQLKAYVDEGGEIAQSGRLSEDSLSADYGTWGDQRELAALEMRGQSDRLSSAGLSRVNFDAAQQVHEDWADLVGWYTEGVGVSGNTLITAAGALHSARLPLDLTGPFRLRGRITFVAGAGLIFLGISTATNAGAPTSGGIVGVGIDVAAGKMMRWHVSSASPTWTVNPGEYLVTVVGDETHLSFAITDATGFLEYTYVVARSAIAPVSGIGLWHSANAGSIRDVTLTRTKIAAPANRVIENFGPSLHKPVVDGQNCRIALPANHAPGQPLPLLMFCHGAGGNENQPWLEWPAMYRDLLGAGYGLIASFMHDRNWGNRDALDDMIELYRYVRDRYPLGPLVLIGNSMGGLASLNALARRELPAAAWVGMQPVCDLDAMYAAGQFITEMRAAYGSNGTDWQAKTEGYNPMEREGWEFRGLPMRFYASPGDTVVSKAQNTDALAAKVAPYATEATVVAATGDHGNASHFQFADLRAFLDRVTRT